MRATIDRIGKYELRTVLARTQLSTVYDGWDTDIQRRVAVKLMPLSSVDDGEAGEAFARFKRGARAAGQLNHPNVVSIHDYGETNEYAFLVMEFVDGPTLKGLFDENRRFALVDIHRIVGSILLALQYSHDRGVVHRDVKPANIMFTAENQIKITDFGIARLEDSEMTQAGMVIGTPAYMSPEQFLGENIDWRTDIYSTGVVLYHLLTGERPYEGNLATIMHKVLYGAPLSPSRISTNVTPALDAVVTRAMARNREDRFRSAAEFSMALDAALASPSASRRERISVSGDRAAIKTAAGTTNRAKSGSRVPLYFVAAVSVLAAGSAVAWFGFLQPNRPSIGTAVQPQTSVLQEQEKARLQEQQARLQQEQDQAREQQARLEQEQQQARLQQEQQVRLQQEAQARLQQEEQARLDQQLQEQARIRQQEQARIQAAREQARQKQEQDRQPQVQEQTRQKLVAEQTRQKPVAEQVRPKPQVEAARPASSQSPSPPQPPDSPQPDRFLPDLIPATWVSGAVGLVCKSITPSTASTYGLDSPQGIVVTGVLAGGIAQKAGLQENDVILKINGTDAHDLSPFSRTAADSQAAQTMPVDILRRGVRKTVQLVLKVGQP